MPNGGIQNEFKDTLRAVGDWISKYGKSIYNTRGNIIEPQNWGVITATNESYFVHLLNADTTEILLPFTEKKLIASALNDNSKIELKREKDGWKMKIPEAAKKETIDYIVEIKVNKK